MSALSRSFPAPGKIQLLGVLVAAVLFVLDQLSKFYIREQLVPYQWSEVAVFPGFNLVHAWNYGVSFSMFTHTSESRAYVLVGVALALCSVILWWLAKASTRLPAFAYGLILGGALGNVFDRLYHGAVFDFLQFYLAEYYWPSFNLADSAIFVGVALLLWESWRGGSKRGDVNA